MATSRQIAANRRNAKRSTGPRTSEGKAVSRFNALKTGIDAKSEVLPEESEEELAALTLEYHDRFNPAAPEQRFLVDTLVASEWQIRRLRKAETELWEYARENSKGLFSRGDDDDYPIGRILSREADVFARIQRRIDSAHRAWHRALKELQRMGCGAGCHPAAGCQPAEEPAPAPKSAPAAEPSGPAPASPPLPEESAIPAPIIGFVPSTREHGRSSVESARPEPEALSMPGELGVARYPLD